MSLKIKLLCVVLSLAMLAPAWLGGSGLTLLVALVPLMMISASYSDSARDWWRMAGWAALTFVLWNAATIWWVWIATPAGPITATLFSTFWNLVGFMLYHYTSKRASKVLAYTLLAATWVATEYLYTSAEVLSFPWLTLGNGFSGDVWAVQWYSLTGVFGGSLWVVLSNIAIFEAVVNRGVWRIVRAAAVVVVPIVASLAMYWSYEPAAKSVEVSVLQPNVDCYEEKFSGSERAQTKNIIELLAEVPSSSKVAVLPETALPERLDDDEPLEGRIIGEFASIIQREHPATMLVIGATTIKQYDSQTKPTFTARETWGGYYDVYNSAVAVNADGEQNLHHKMRLVIGVEAMPFTGFLDKFVDLGGITGQLGRNDKAAVFDKGGVKYGPAICYEGIYGDCFARFVREGAEVMLVMSNDGWWGNTPGHRRLFDYCRLRAIETRRAIARSANTGVSGFINARGDIIQSLGWEKRGVLTQSIEVREEITPYVTYGDWVGRMSLLVALLGVLYYSAYSIKRKNHLV
ncbi:MAG: apolipoprotein N-acyltransferase [Alistipes sp.]|nr:apolipoprotein N-acyltransferase [Alistipes sp.]